MKVRLVCIKNNKNAEIEWVGETCWKNVAILLNMIELGEIMNHQDKQLTLSLIKTYKFWNE